MNNHKSKIINQPTRIQRKRNLGWRMPENTKCVDRTSKYGNPFKVKGDMIYADASHRRKIMDLWVHFSGPFPKEEIMDELMKLYRAWVLGASFNQVVRPRTFTTEQMRYELTGKNLACFCSLDHPCHADVLLKLANPELKMEN